MNTHLAFVIATQAIDEALSPLTSLPESDSWQMEAATSDGVCWVNKLEASAERHFPALALTVSKLLYSVKAVPRHVVRRLLSLNVQ